MAWPRTLVLTPLIALAILALSPIAAQAGWERIDRVPGKILDVDTERILFVDTDGTLQVKDRATQALTTVSLPPGDVAQYGYLTSHGAIFVAGADTIGKHVYEWRDGTVIDFGQPNSATSLVVAGKYAIWNGAPLLFRRDLDAGTTITVSTNAGNTDNDVAPNGDVVFWRSTGSDYEIFRYRAGVTTQLTSHPSRWNTYPLTDGTNVVFRNHSPCCGTEDGYIAVYTAAGQEIALDSQRNDWPEPRVEYAAAGGWVAYTKAGPGSSLEVWTRSPGGVHRRVSPPGMNAWIAGLNPLGEVILYERQTTRNYFTRPGAPVVDLGPEGSYGRMVKWLDGRWYELWGPALNELRIATYVRPKSATVVRASLVIAYRPCESPNRQHGPPLAAASCAPPRPASDYLTVGTADANFNPPKFQGYMHLRALAGEPTTVADEADLRLDVDVSDVRRAADLADYTGELQGRLSVELTDKDNTDTPAGPPCATIPDTTPIQVTTCAPHGLVTGAQVRVGGRFAPCATGQWIVTVTGANTFTLDDSTGCGPDRGPVFWREHTEVGPSAATGQPASITFGVPCEATEDANVGARCDVSTTADAIVPDLVREGKRAIWQLGAIEVYDGGPDGDADTVANNTLFARQGVFVP